MSFGYLRGTTEWALMVALVFGAGAAARAQDDENPDNNVIQIGRADGDDVRPNLPHPGDRGDRGDRERPAAPEYWIGLKGGLIPEDHPLRAHLDLPEKQGLLVDEVMPNSPAAKAGIKRFDIMLKANNGDLHEMKNLVELVATEGPKKGQITLEVLRRNKRETVYLTPEKTPDNVRLSQGGGAFEGGPGGPGMPGFPEDFLEQFRGRVPMEFRNFGPGVIVGGGEGFGNMPNGVSFSMQKQDGKPAHITVQRGNDKWEIDGDNAEAMKKLPEDLRPFVERMVHGGGGRVGFFNGPGPNRDRDFGPEFDGGRMRERLERMEKRLEEMQRRLHGSDAAPEKPQAEKDQSK